jgi:predicted amidohydrolase YtcJ
MRIYTIITANLLEFLPSTPKIDAVLIFTDGYLASQTAALNEPYTDNLANRGTLLYTQDELNRLVAKIQQVNLQAIIHATGDKAIDAALKSLEANPPEHSKNKKPHRLEQAAVLNKQLIQRIKKQNLIISIQPQVIQSEFTTWQVTQHLGNKRAKMLYPINTLLSKKIVVAGGSDCPMEPLNPLIGMRSAATRKFFSNERITFEDALRLYTVNAAYATSEEDVRGSLEEGKLADLTVLSNDPTLVTPEKIVSIGVELTIIGGKVLYQRNDPKLS